MVGKYCIPPCEDPSFPTRGNVHRPDRNLSTVLTMSFFRFGTTKPRKRRRRTEDLSMLRWSSRRSCSPEIIYRGNIALVGIFLGYLACPPFSTKYTAQPLEPSSSGKLKPRSRIFSTYPLQPWIFILVLRTRELFINGVSLSAIPEDYLAGTRNLTLLNSNRACDS